MADGNPIMVPIELPGEEAYALGHLLKRLDYDACGRLTDKRIVYADRSERDVAWSARGMILRQLEEAGFGPK